MELNCLEVLPWAVWAGPNGMIFIILRLPNEVSWLYFGQLKGGNFFFLTCLICFDLWTDLRKAKLYAELIEGQKADLIHAFSSLNKMCRGILSFSNQKN